MIHKRLTYALDSLYICSCFRLHTSMVDNAVIGFAGGTAANEDFGL